MPLEAISPIEKMLYRQAKVSRPVDKVSVVMAGYRENEIDIACKSITQQTIIQKFPGMFEFIFVGLDTYPEDTTIKTASKYADTVYTIGKRGKLTAMNYGISRANNSLIATVDADTYYLPHYMAAILRPFNQRGKPNRSIAATAGFSFEYSIPYVPGPIATLNAMYNHSVKNINRVAGRNGVFWKDYFIKAGRYNENINQLNTIEMQNEEEIGLGNRLRKFGRIIHVANASNVHLGGTKVFCRNAYHNPDYFAGDLKRLECATMGMGTERF